MLDSISGAHHLLHRNKKGDIVASSIHTPASREAGYRFYALYDKIVREDILAHAYARDKPGHDDVDRFKHLFAGESERTTPPIAGAPGNCLGSDID